METKTRNGIRPLALLVALALVALATFDVATAAADPAPTTTQLTASATNPFFMTAVTLQATVVGTAPSGTVTFLDGTTLLGSAPPDATGTAQLVVSTLTVGAHSITASFAGDANNAPSVSAPTVVTVFQKSKTDLLVYSQPKTKATTWTASTALVLVANVIKVAPSGTKVAPTGSVNFNVDGVITVVPVVGLHHANLILPNGLPLGIHHATATYTGDANYRPSSSPIRTIKINVDLTTSISATPDPVTAGGNVQYTVTVTNNGLTTASSVQLVDTLPAGTSVVSATAPSGCTVGPSVVCMLGKLTVHNSAVATIVVQAPGGGGTITDTATASPGANNVAVATTTVTF